MLTLSIVSLTAYLVADLLRVKPVYDQLLAELLSGRAALDAQPTGEKVLLSRLSATAPPPDKKSAKSDGALLSSSRSCAVNEIVPNGETVIRAGTPLPCSAMKRFRILCTRRWKMPAGAW
ncbi:MAG: hypothetical protein ACLSAP_11530 [Oscillospiraceae bacterium]